MILLTWWHHCGWGQSSRSILLLWINFTKFGAEFLTLRPSHFPIKWIGPCNNCFIAQVIIFKWLLQCVKMFIPERIYIPSEWIFCGRFCRKWTNLKSYLKFKVQRHAFFRIKNACLLNFMIPYGFIDCYCKICFAFLSTDQSFLFLVIVGQLSNGSVHERIQDSSCRPGITEIKDAEFSGPGKRSTLFQLIERQIGFW